MLKAHFSRFLTAGPPGRLHCAAHSHHPWPDVTRDAHQQAWLDAARFIDDKWSHLFATVWPEAQGHVASALGLPNPSSIVFAPNTHEFVLRILSSLPDRARVVTSDAEFHSFERQTRRLEEDGVLQVERVPSEPFATFAARLVEATRRVRPHLVFFSEVFFNSGARIDHLEQLVQALPPEPLVVIDGYHAFLATPTNLGPIASRAFYLAGGYKYAMAGEGACFLHVPPGDFRPRNTGWFAAFGALHEKIEGRVPFAPAGSSFMGATFDPSGLYRFNAVMKWRASVGLTVEASLAHVHGLQRHFVDGLGSFAPGELVVPISNPNRGQFLTFRTPDAQRWCDALKALQVDTDARNDRLRFGFGVYHDLGDVEVLLSRVKQARW